MFRIRDVLRQNIGTEAPLMSSMDDPADDSGGAMASSVDPDTGEAITVDAAGDTVAEEKTVPDTADTLANAGGGEDWQKDKPPDATPEYMRQAAQAGLVWNSITNTWEKPGAPPAPRAPKRGGGPPAATMEVSGTRSPFMGLLRDETMAAARAVKASADAQAAQDLETANVYDEMAQTLDDSALELRRIQQDAMQHAQESSARLQAQADELGATEPQAGRLFGTGAQAAGFGAALSIAAGAMLSVRTGGPNVALAIVNKAIERDLLAQREAIRNKKDALTAGMSIARQMQAAYQNDITAEKAVQATLQRYAENRLKAIISRTSGPILQAQAQEKIAKLGLDFAGTLEEVTRENYQLRVSGPVTRLQNMVATALGQTLPPATNPGNQGNGDAEIAGAIDAAKGLKNGAKVQRGKAGQKAARGQAAVDAATWKPTENNPLFLVRTGADGQPQYMPNSSDPIIAQGVVNKQWGAAGGIIIPNQLAGPMVQRGLPRGWLHRDAGNGRTRIYPASTLRPASAEEVAKLDQFRAKFIPLPKSSADNPQGVEIVTRMVNGREQTGFWADPQMVGGAKLFAQARAKLNADLESRALYNRIYEDVEEAIKDSKGSASRLLFTLTDPAMAVNMGLAASIFTRLADGGVMGDTEFNRASENFGSPNAFTKEQAARFIAGGKSAQGWTRLKKIIDDKLRSSFQRLATGADTFTGGGGESSDTQTSRPPTSKGASWTNSGGKAGGR